MKIKGITSTGITFTVTTDHADLKDGSADFVMIASGEGCNHQKMFHGRTSKANIHKCLRSLFDRVGTVTIR